MNDRDTIINLRKKNYSVEEIKAILDSKEHNISQKTIYNILKEEGFSKLPRRTKKSKSQLSPAQIPADKSITLDFDTQENSKVHRQV
jgi:DNA-binding transcriptional MerR regulator